MDCSKIVDNIMGYEESLQNRIFLQFVVCLSFVIKHPLLAGNSRDNGMRCVMF